VLNARRHDIKGKNRKQYGSFEKTYQLKMKTKNKPNSQKVFQFFFILLVCYYNKQ